MQKLSDLNNNRIFKYFEEITSIPRGSGNMEKISDYCMRFADEHNLKAVKDAANNVIIYKPATKGYEDKEPVILQGHLDMVCQKEDLVEIDFEKDGISVIVDGDFIKANGTTLGADNGIAVAIILSILESSTLSHPAIEAVFTTDEEIGMIGAKQLDFSCLRGKKMINLDSESPDVLTVSCAGGSDFCVDIPFVGTKRKGSLFKFKISGLTGGHSGVEINSGRINANILMGRFLNYLNNITDISVVSVNGGDKGNAIPRASVCEFVMPNDDAVKNKLSQYIQTVKNEIIVQEPDFNAELKLVSTGEHNVLDKNLSDKIIYMLTCAPNGVVEISAEIDNLVQTSLNLGILKTDEDKISVLFTLRSNKKSAHDFLEQKLATFFSGFCCEIKTSGHYPPWEFKKDSDLQKLYIDVFNKKFGFEPTVEAIHAGLECGVFDSAINDFDCISIGPKMFDIHTPGERVSISSTNDVYELVIKMLSMF